jgi:uncharacterized protein (TIGR02284 family)
MMFFPMQENLFEGNHMNNDEVISTLNDLIETCKDGEESYKTCATDAAKRKSDLQTTFANLQHGCAAAAAELQDLVHTEGGKARTESNVGDAIHRGWVNLKTAIGGNNDEAVLVECERGEDSAKHNYSVALKQDLPAHVRAVVERQYQGVLVNHEKIKAQRDQLKVDA